MLKNPNNCNPKEIDKHLSSPKHAFSNKTFHFPHSKINPVKPDSFLTNPAFEPTQLLQEGYHKHWELQ